jgi:hypothetical protein
MAAMAKWHQDDRTQSGCAFNLMRTTALRFSFGKSGVVHESHPDFVRLHG